MTTMSSEQSGYYAYLLRLWQVDLDESAPWRVSLEDAATGERKGFADLASMYRYLADQIRETSSAVRLEA
ncbi:MAG TPA: hypothetical protein VGK87_02515, partial [Anaerolineae bacterium]